jgi:hypothetical protein
MYFEVCRGVHRFYLNVNILNTQSRGYGQSIRKTVTYSQNMIIRGLLGNGFDLSNEAT